jgi:uncharacterized protein (TIGR02679 family)
MPDHARLTRLFTGPDLAPLLLRLRQRVERGIPLTGTLVLTGLSTSQGEAVRALLGRAPSASDVGALTVPLDELAARLAAAGLCHSLHSAVELLTGPIANTPAAREDREAAWAAVFTTAPSALHAPPYAAWLDELRANGSLKRFAQSSPVAARELLARLARVAAALPARGEPLAAFAAVTLGNAHALDPGTSLATLALRAAARLGGIAIENENAENRRDAWASVGVMCDELSVPALVLNLPSASDTPLGRLLRSAAADAEPLHVSLRLLLRFPLARDSALAGREIFVCENPAIVALAAAHLGRRCAPLLCLNGQFATPSLVLLRQLRAAGARLRVHADFDAAGIHIVRRALAEGGAQPWRFTAADYLAAPQGESLPFGGLPATPWDPPLSSAMNTARHAVHEEAVFSTLAADLALTDPPASFR